MQSGLHRIILIICLGVFDVGGSLREVSLLLVEEAQLVEREGNQVVVVPDAPLTGEHLSEAQLGLK